MEAIDIYRLYVKVGVAVDESILGSVKVWLGRGNSWVPYRLLFSVGLPKMSQLPRINRIWIRSKTFSKCLANATTLQVCNTSLGEALTLSVVKHTLMLVKLSFMLTLKTPLSLEHYTKLC